MIHERAIECFELLSSSLDHFDGPNREKAREQLGRFNLWASNIGVFATAPTSLDYRLRDAPVVAETFMGLLTALSVRVRHG
jgi:hypothetical protein